MDEKLLREWHPERNLGVDPLGVHPGAGKKYWWICSIGHEWEATPSNRRAGSGCPYCGNKRLLPGYNDFATGNPGLALEWDKERNSFAPESILMGADIKVWWRCKEGHSYVASTKKRTKRGHGCPYCSGRSILPGYNDLASQRPALMAEWDWSKNTLDPAMTAVHHGGRAWWICTAGGHSWESIIANRSRGSSCPECSSMVSKEEKEVVNFLHSRFPQEPIIENDRTVISPQEVDILLPRIRVAVEYNGVHWHDKETWLQDVIRGSFESREAKKRRSCEEVGITLIHVWSDDWKAAGDTIRSSLENNIATRL